jgi:hypothetical protein
MNKRLMSKKDHEGKMDKVNSADLRKNKLDNGTSLMW